MNIYCNVTITAWMNPNPVQIGGYTSIFCKGYQSSYTGYEFQFNAANKFQFRINPTSSSTVYVPGTSAEIVRGSWQQGGAVYNGTNITFYRNGLMTSSHAAGGQLYPAPGQNARLGSYVSAVDYQFNGTLDELRISSVARSADWIKAEYGQTYVVGSEQAN
ncbi:Concanavalin A-like lectin/glucanases superfamily protein [uncultured archaeon]|nr:Concanavalin A-like lectin/glucanases superfamily protein [uncultured archaeon]